mmetsp:Transcript_32220/g.69252  ORF Transcript_32220/g.69252 Transcript_32220/m.69252 type:complete len:239 (-) Transcript_32220:74-790(-)
MDTGGIVMLVAVEGLTVPLDHINPLLRGVRPQLRARQPDGGLLVKGSALGGDLGDNGVLHAVVARLLEEALLRLREEKPLEGFEKLDGHVGSAIDPRRALADVTRRDDGAGCLLEVVAGRLHALRVPAVLGCCEERERGGHVEEDAGALVLPVGVLGSDGGVKGVVPLEEDGGFIESRGAEVERSVSHDLVVAQQHVPTLLGSVLVERRELYAITPRGQLVDETVASRPHGFVEVLGQ